jgi:hypothetical protein
LTTTKTHHFHLRFRFSSSCSTFPNHRISYHCHIAVVYIAHNFFCKFPLYFEVFHFSPLIHFMPYVVVGVLCKRRRRRRICVNVWQCGCSRKIKSRKNFSFDLFSLYAHKFKHDITKQYVIIETFMNYCIHTHTHTFTLIINNSFILLLNKETNNF